MNAQRIVRLIYTLITIFLIASFFYTANSYFTVYRGSHNLNIDVQSFNVTRLNSTHAMTETVIVIHNPSGLTFEIIYVEERLTHESWGATGSAFILTDMVWFSSPKSLQPLSDVTVALNTVVLFERIQSTSTVFAELKAFIEGPIVGRFLLRSYERL